MNRLAHRVRIEVVDAASRVLLHKLRGAGTAIRNAHAFVPIPFLWLASFASGGADVRNRARYSFSATPTASYDGDDPFNACYFESCH